MDPIVEVNDLSFEYPQAIVFRRFNARLRPGLTVLTGEEGSGKTTLLRLLAGALPMQAGDIMIGGASIRHNPDAHSHQVYWADPMSDALDQISAREYFARLRTHYPAFPAENTPSLARLIEGLSLEPHLHKPLYMLSTGSKRKVWLVGALAAHATVTLLDDPLAALDKPSIQCVLHEFAKAARATRRTLVVAQYGPLPDAVSPVHQIDLSVRQ